MNVGKINLSTQKYSSSIGFKSEYENPVSRGTERNLAVLSSVTGSLVAGAVIYGLSSCLVKTEPMAEKTLSAFFKAKKLPLGIGAAAAAIALLVTLPAKLYNTNVNAFVKQKEMDVFSRDRDLKSNLTEQVGQEVKDPEVNLDKKLDDNLKLQIANRGGAIAIANVTSQPQG